MSFVAEAESSWRATRRGTRPAGRVECRRACRGGRRSFRPRRTDDVPASLPVDRSLRSGPARRRHQPSPMRAALRAAGGDRRHRSSRCAPRDESPPARRKFYHRVLESRTPPVLGIEEFATECRRKLTRRAPFPEIDFLGNPDPPGMGLAMRRRRIPDPGAFPTREARRRSVPPIRGSGRCAPEYAGRRGALSRSDRPLSTVSPRARGRRRLLRRFSTCRRLIRISIHDAAAARGVGRVQAMAIATLRDMEIPT
mgnify:CR=1 FL=1